ncbi:DUF3667 domain-containing protein [Congregibacter sp.]|uniref:DUF3667 domain-containing protein n=1 Tax=Congregibacter sp. TaxID=2744308 RepID=UPI003F6B4967
MEGTTARCRNCDTPLDGPYCHHCGQREGRGDLHFQEAVTDILGDVFTLDSRIWRTLFSLIFRPGFLSAEFNAGRRMRYMPPFRLYIIVSFILFLTLSFMTNFVLDFGATSDDPDGVSVTFGLEDNVTAEELESALADAVPETVDEVLQEKLAEKQAAGDEEAVQALKQIEQSMDEGEVADGFTVNFLTDGPPWLEEIETRIEANAAQVSDDPADYISQLLEYLPQVMFIMLPLFALLLKVAYLFSPFHYLQHLVFALHYHTFVYLLYLLSTLIGQAGFHVDGSFAMFLIIYLPLALRRTYDSSWSGAGGKSLFLVLSYGTALFLGMAITAVAVLAAM